MYIQQIALLSGLALQAAASPKGVTNGRFSIPAIRLRDSEPELQGRQASNASTSISLDSHWFIPVTIGTPPQSFIFLGDSGSVNLAVGSTLLPKDQQSKSPKYDPSKSSTAKRVEGYTYKSCFASGYCSSGLVYDDVFTLGDLVVPHQRLGVQTNNSELGSDIRSGTLGLNFDHNGQTTKPSKSPSWLMNIVPELEAGLFTVDYNANTAKGSFDFGFIDANKHTGPIGYAPVIKGSSEWTVKITGLQLANGTMAASEGWPVTVDTGTSTAGLPPSVAADYFSQIERATFNEAQKRYTFPCTSQLVDFTFAIGTFRGTIPASRMKSKATTNGGKTCTSKLKVNVGTGNSLWGQALIEEFLVVFDWDGARVGFGKKASAAVEASPIAAVPTMSPLQTEDDESSASLVSVSQVLLVLGLAVMCLQ